MDAKKTASEALTVFISLSGCGCLRRIKSATRSGAKPTALAEDRPRSAGAGHR